ncbi:MAG: hypothetical protein IPK16_06805 [Anaerolineales bacterium]|nr:hypothetical protein [Anaerolineales bacterium]
MKPEPDDLLAGFVPVLLELEEVGALFFVLVLDGVDVLFSELLAMFNLVTR